MVVSCELENVVIKKRKTCGKMGSVQQAGQATDSELEKLNLSFFLIWISLNKLKDNKKQLPSEGSSQTFGCVRRVAAGSKREKPSPKTKELFVFGLCL